MLSFVRNHTVFVIFYKMYVLFSMYFYTVLHICEKNVGLTCHKFRYGIYISPFITSLFALWYWVCVEMNGCWTENLVLQCSCTFCVDTGQLLISDFAKCTSFMKRVTELIAWSAKQFTWKQRSGSLQLPECNLQLLGCSNIPLSTCTLHCHLI